MIVFQRVGAAHAAVGLGTFDLAFASFGTAPAVATTYVLASNFADRRPAVAMRDRRATVTIRDRRSTSDIDQP